jgi:periplasmic protein TonB
MRRPIRILAYLTLSLLIHLGVSQLFAGSAVTRQAPRTVKVALVSQAAPQKPAVAQQPKPRQEPRKKQEPLPRPEPPKPVAEPVKESEPPVSPEPPPVATSPASAAPEPTPAVSAIDAATAADIYQRKVLDIIRHNLKYPGNARRRGIEGTVSVRFTIHGSGSVGEIQIVRSSGAALLDKASLETIRRCAFPPPPRASMTLNVPITFRLTEEM